MSWLVDSAVLQDVVPLAVTDVCELCQELPFQYWLLLERWTCTRTLETPPPVSAAVPQMRDDGEQPADHVAEL